MACLVVIPASVMAATQTKSGSVNITAQVNGPAPATPAVITSPSNKTVSKVTPIVVSGTCGPGLTVKVFNNGELAGTTTCSLSGEFTVNLVLNIGKNVLTALNYDTLDQAGPASPSVSVNVESKDKPNNGDGSGNTGSQPTGTGTSQPNQPTRSSPTVPGGPTIPKDSDDQVILPTFVRIQLFLFVILTSLILVVSIKIKNHKKLSD